MSSSMMFLGFVVAVLAIAVLAAGQCATIKRTAQDIIRKERERLRSWAYQYAEELAHQRVKEILSELRISVDVKLVNESDLAWGQDSIEHNRNKFKESA